MSVMEGAVALIAIAVVVLVVVLVLTLLRMQRTMAELQVLIHHTNAELGPLVRDCKQTLDEMEEFFDEARQDLGRASVFLRALGDVGETVQSANDAVRRRTHLWGINLASWAAGLRTVLAVMRGKERAASRSGGSNGNA